MGEGYVRLYEEDIEQLQGELPIERQREGDGVELIAKLKTCLTPEGDRVCAALNGCIGVRCSCSIYERRPVACRRFAVGGSLCREARQRFNLPV
jgi:Fe-S-cluster containining protein